MKWSDIKHFNLLKLYAGDLSLKAKEMGFIGLSLNRDDSNHIKHNVVSNIPLENNSVDIYQSEDVFEHIQYDLILSIIEDVYRVLKFEGMFRLSMPDYRCNILFDRTLKDNAGNLVFDPGGGGTMQNPGHVWFPKYENVKNILDKSSFAKYGEIKYLHYYKSDFDYVLKPIDYSSAYVSRTPDNDFRVHFPFRPMSIVVDMIKRGSRI